MQDRAALGIGLALASMFGFACMDAMSKLLTERYALSQILWFRYIVFTAFALLMVWSRGPIAVWRSERPWLQLSRALLLLLENWIFVLAFMHLPLADVHAIAAASPLIVIALSVPLLGEKVGIRRWLAVSVGFLGVLLIVRPGFKVVEWPLMVALLGAVMWAAYQIMVRLSARYDSSQTTLMWSAVIGLAGASLVGPFQWVTPDARGWVLLTGVAFAGSLSHYALIKALEYAEASALQPYSYALLVFAALLGFLVFGHLPDVWTLSGAAVIVASGLYSWNRERVRAAGG